jgi:hypothetical protein
MSNWSPKVAAVPLKRVENVNPRAVAAPLTDASERELLERIARSKDQVAFRTLYGNYYQRLSPRNFAAHRNCPPGSSASPTGGP